MDIHDTRNFKGTALDDSPLRRESPIIFASGPMAGVSNPYPFVPTARIVDGLREQHWMPVGVEEQRSPEALGPAADPSQVPHVSQSRQHNVFSAMIGPE